jgi:hypothetical protein
MPLAICRERDELEKRINSLLRLLLENSRKGADLAQHHAPDANPQFMALHNADTLLRERLATLKDCLELHKDLHGC